MVNIIQDLKALSLKLKKEKEGNCMKILVTGGLGFIGSHTTIELINNGHEVVIVDNLVNSKIEVLDRIEKITKVRPKFYKINLTILEDVRKIFDENDFIFIVF